MSAGESENFTTVIADASTVADVGPVRLLWTDVPFGTGKVQQQQGVRYSDPSDTEYVVKAVTGWIPQMDDDGTIVVCCDYRLTADIITAIQLCAWCYRGEIIWEFGLGRPRASWWPVRHNNLLTFTQTQTSGLFDYTAVPRVKRLDTAKKYKGKSYPEDKPAGSVWDFTMSVSDSQRVGYPNQKPVEIIEPFVLAHTNLGDLVVDPFMGSGSTGEAALRNGRRFYGCDVSPDAVEIAANRLSHV